MGNKIMQQLNFYTKEKIDLAIKDMNDLIARLSESFKEAKIDGLIKIASLNSQLILDDVPQDFFIIQYDSKDVIIQMIKPMMRPCFYFVKDDVHVFTDMIQEVMCFFKGIEFLN